MRCAKFSKLSFAEKLRICSCLACVYQVMDARGKFGEHEKCVRVARGAAESNSSFPIGWSKTRHILYFGLSENI